MVCLYLRHSLLNDKVHRQSSFLMTNKGMFNSPDLTEGEFFEHEKKTF